MEWCDLNVKVEVRLLKFDEELLHTAILLPKKLHAKTYLKLSRNSQINEIKQQYLIHEPPIQSS